LAWILGTAAAKPQEAIQFADRGVSKYPADPHLRDTRAAILIRLGRLDEARADLEQCLNLTRESPATRVSALRQLGGVLVKQGQAEKARQSYAEALKTDQDSHVLAEADRKAIQETIQSLPR
jgi:Flp pilus assembly protein TadD